ncbi:hypothetical protein N7507_010020 [Penicillium longicatenatum]|nr:hypothetical protein N7507_010020 [Penicillium longicatenatum]
MLKSGSLSALIKQRLKPRAFMVVLVKPSKSSTSESLTLHPNLDVDETLKSLEASSVIGVESNKKTRYILVLQSLGFHISRATNGQQALDAIQHDKFDCILMDQEMPVMDGTSATIEIRKLDRDSTANIPIIGVTANVRATQQIAMLDAGMDNIIHKPYRTNDLFEKINQLLLFRSKR